LGQSVAVESDLVEKHALGGIQSALDQEVMQIEEVNEVKEL
jgi:hypothetical protein